MPVSPGGWTAEVGHGAILTRGVKAREACAPLPCTTLATHRWRTLDRVVLSLPNRDGYFDVHSIYLLYVSTLLRDRRETSVHYLSMISVLGLGGCLVWLYAVERRLHAFTHAVVQMQHLTKASTETVERLTHLVTDLEHLWKESEEPMQDRQ